MSELEALLPAPARETPSVVGYLRKWAFDKEEPRKEKNANGRWAWPKKFILKPITTGKCLADDVALMTVAQHERIVASLTRPAQTEQQPIPLRLRELAHVGEHMHDDYSWKARHAKLRGEIETLKRESAAFNAVIGYMLGKGFMEEPMEFLRCWNGGDFDSLREEWPEAPQEIYYADPLADHEAIDAATAPSHE